MPLRTNSPRKLTTFKIEAVNQLRQTLVIQEAHLTPLLGANDEELFQAKNHLNQAINALVEYVNR